VEGEQPTQGPSNVGSVGTGSLDQVISSLGL
jgi:hypothetical protein